MVAHAADLVVRVVIVAAVGAGDGVRAGSETVLPSFVVDVRLGALGAFLAMVCFLMVASALAASDLAGWVDLVSVFPASGTLDEVDLLDPSGHTALSVDTGGKGWCTGLVHCKYTARTWTKYPLYTGLGTGSIFIIFQADFFAVFLVQEILGTFTVSPVM